MLKDENNWNLINLLKRFNLKDRKLHKGEIKLDKTYLQSSPMLIRYNNEIK